MKKAVLIGSVIIVTIVALGIIIQYLYYGYSINKYENNYDLPNSFAEEKTSSNNTDTDTDAGDTGVTKETSIGDGSKKSIDDNDNNSYIIAFIGDQGDKSEATRVLQLIKNENTEALVILGDFDYGDNPKNWYSMLTSVLGKNFPIIAVIGNHDEKAWNQYSEVISDHLKNTPNVACDGITAIKSTCTFKDIQVIITAPGIETQNISNQAYANYITDVATKYKSAMTTSGSDNEKWNICAWHKNQKLMQVGQKIDETGWEIYQACEEEGFPIMTAHEHSYSRSFLMDDIKNQKVSEKSKTSIALTANLPGFNNTNQIDQLNLEKGKSFVVVSGLGGKSIREQAQFNNPWWSSIYTSTQGAKPGALFCVFNYLDKKDTALCYFKNIDREVIDAFEMNRAK